jgi:hypothetical protein
VRAHLESGPGLIRMFRKLIPLCSLCAVDHQKCRFQTGKAAMAGLAALRKALGFRYSQTLISSLPKQLRYALKSGNQEIRVLCYRVAMRGPLTTVPGSNCLGMRGSLSLVALPSLTGLLLRVVSSSMDTQSRTAKLAGRPHDSLSIFLLKHSPRVDLCLRSISMKIVIRAWRSVR